MLQSPESTGGCCCRQGFAGSVLWAPGFPSLPAAVRCHRANQKRDFLKVYGLKATKLLPLLPVEPSLCDLLAQGAV